MRLRVKAMKMRITAITPRMKSCQLIGASLLFGEQSGKITKSNRRVEVSSANGEKAKPVFTFDNCN